MLFLHRKQDFSIFCFIPCFINSYMEVTTAVVRAIWVTSQCMHAGDFTRFDGEFQWIWCQIRFIQNCLVMFKSGLITVVTAPTFAIRHGNVPIAQREDNLCAGWKNYLSVDAVTSPNRDQSLKYQPSKRMGCNYLSIYELQRRFTSSWPDWFHASPGDITETNHLRRIRVTRKIWSVSSDAYDCMIRKCPGIARAIIQHCWNDENNNSNYFHVNSTTLTVEWTLCKDVNRKDLRCTDPCYVATKTFDEPTR